MISSGRVIPLLLFSSLFACSLGAQVSSSRLVQSSKEPQNWLTYSGNYAGQRYSLLDQVNLANVKNLELKWVFQEDSLQKIESTPLVVNGIMYLTEAQNDLIALDAKTGAAFWVFHYHQSRDARTCCGGVSRGVAILGDSLFMTTIDAHLVSVDAKNGHVLWDVKVANPAAGYAMTMAPLLVKDKVIVGVAGAEYGIRGFIAAYDAATGAEAWKFYTTAGPGDPGSATWRGNDWEHGGGSVWVTGTYDPDLNLTYWGIGNPSPDYNSAQRPGDNLYTDSVVALDADTGKLKWHFQYTPADNHDYDSVQVPVLADINWEGHPRKVLMQANRNGFFYVLDRATGAFLLGRPFINLNWASGLNAAGRPIETPQPPGAPTYPGLQGGTSWYSPSYSPRTGLFYIPAWKDYAMIFSPAEAEYQAGRYFMGGTTTGVVPGRDTIGLITRGPINTYTEAAGHGAVIALDPHTGEKKWSFEMHDVTESGILTTATDLLFAGGREGYFQALNARTGEVLWKVNLGGQVISGPNTFEVDGKQYIAISAGRGLFVFGLKN